MSHSEQIIHISGNYESTKIADHILENGWTWAILIFMIDKKYCQEQVNNV